MHVFLGERRVAGMLRSWDVGSTSLPWPAGAVSGRAYRETASPFTLCESVLWQPSHIRTCIGACPRHVYLQGPDEISVFRAAYYNNLHRPRTLARRRYRVAMLIGSRSELYCHQRRRCSCNDTTARWTYCTSDLLVRRASQTAKPTHSSEVLHLRRRLSGALKMPQQ